MNAMRMQECLQPIQMQDLLAGETLSDVQVEHLSQCKKCQQKLDETTDSFYLRSFSSERATPYSFLEPPLREMDLGSLKGSLLNTWCRKEVWGLYSLVMKCDWIEELQ